MYLFKHLAGFGYRNLIKVIKRSVGHNLGRPIAIWSLIADFILFRLIERLQTLAVTTVGDTFQFTAIHRYRPQTD